MKSGLIYKSKNYLAYASYSNNLVKSIWIVSCVLFLGLLFLFSCSKEKEADLCSDPSLMRELRMGDQASQGLTYDSNCKVSELLEPFKYSKFTYNNLGQLVKVEEAMSINPLSCVAIPGGDGGSFGDPRSAKITVYSEYEYNSNGKLEKRTFYHFNQSDVAVKSGYELYHYNENNIDSIKYYSVSGLLNNYRTYLYDHGNLKVQKYFIMTDYKYPRLVNTIEYEFDDKNNPYRVLAIEGSPGKYTNKNNIIKETYISVSDGKENKYVTTYSYQYNDAGNPVKINNNTVVYGNQP